MNNTITDDMIKDFNTMLQLEGSLVRLARENEESIYIEIKLPEDKFISFSRINLNEDFYKMLEDFFIRGCGISKLSFDDTGTTLWSFRENIFTMIEREGLN